MRSKFGEETLILGDLDEVDWASLTHAYGDATDVPGLLRSLLFVDPKAREEASYKLFGNVWHQGTVYGASAAVVPFLYSMLIAPEVQDKPIIAHLLACIAGGAGYLEVHAVDPLGESSWRKILAEQGKSLAGELAREASEVGSVRRAASPSLRRLLPFLGDDEADIRWSVATALGRYPEHTPWSLPAIEQALETEPDEEVREALSDSRARLENHNT